MAFYKCSFSETSSYQLTGKKSFILPDNITSIVVNSSDGTLNLSWSSPSDSEVQISKFNIYYCKSDNEPTSLEDFTLHGTALLTDNSYVLDGLENNARYYVVIESVSIDDYENASLRNMSTGIPAPIRFVCVGSNGLSYYSTNGTSWVAMSGLYFSSSETLQYNDVAYGNGRFVCVGSKGYSHYSVDGVSWTAMTGISGDRTQYAVTYGNDRFVCVGAGGLSYYSTDGVSWTAMSGLNAENVYYGVTYGNDMFVCVGQSGVSYYSTNGTTWVASSGLDTYTCNDVTYGNGRFVCVGTDGVSYYSADGKTWKTMTGLNSSILYLAVAYGNGRFVCVGASGSSYYSTDGETWVAMSGLASGTYNGVISDQV